MFRDGEKKKDLSLEIDYCNKHLNMNIIST